MSAVNNDMASRNTSEKAKAAARARKVAADDQRAADEAREQAQGGSLKSKTKPMHAAPDEVPPYCYRLPGMSADEAAVATVREMRISHPCDALALLWELRRADQGAANELCEAEPSPNAKKRDSARFCNLSGAIASDNPNHEVPA